MKQTTFKKDGYKKIICPNCGHYMKANVYLGEKNYRAIRCWKCKAVSLIYPPRKDINEENERIIRWGPNEGVYTADLTENEIEDTMKPESEK